MLDTMAFIYAMDGRPIQDPDGVDNLRYRARVLMRQLEDAKSEIVVPSIVVSELLVPMSETERQSFLASIQANFFCPAFDLHAASVAAELHRLHKSVSATERYTQRSVLKADCMIIATAKAVGATEFYSHDAKARKLASCVMTALDLPKKADNFVDDMDIRGELPPK